MDENMLNFEYRDISKVIPNDRNTRLHSDEQVAAVADSLRAFGWTRPIVVDEGGVILAGHGVTEAARLVYQGGGKIEHCPKNKVPVVVKTGLTDEQKRAYIIADNKLALDSHWDDEKLAIELSELMDAGFDVDLTGFSGSDLNAVLRAAEGKDGLTDEDNIPEAQDDPIAALGDVWILGKHRLVCGDSTDADVVAKCLNGVEPHLMVTDPPYGVGYSPDWRNHAKRPDGKPYGASATGLVQNDDNADWREAWALFPGDVAYVWHAGNKAHIVAESLEACEFNIRAQIIWAKNNIVIGRGDYHRKHEPCWYAVKQKAVGHWQGDRKQSTVWNIDKPMKSETGHGTQKPVECMRRPIVNNSSPGQVIYEPFNGSGTTIIAAETERRICYAIELSPNYVDVAIRRWQDYTGERAVRESDGVLFDETEKAA